MNRALVRMCLVAVGFLAEAWLLMTQIGFGLGSVDSGRADVREFSSGIGALVVLLFAGWVLSLRGSRRSLLVAELLGVMLLVVGLVLVVGYRSVYLNDASGPAVAFGLVMPATVVFGGVWMMGKTGPLVGPSSSRRK